MRGSDDKFVVGPEGVALFAGAGSPETAWRSALSRELEVPVVHHGPSSNDASPPTVSSGSAREQSLPRLFGDLLALGFRPGTSSVGDHNRIASAIETLLRELGSQSEPEPQPEPPPQQ